MFGEKKQEAPKSDLPPREVSLSDLAYKLDEVLRRQSSIEAMLRTLLDRTPASAARSKR